MKRRALFILLLTAALCASAEEQLRGIVQATEPDGSVTAVAGAAVYWLGTTVGTSTGIDGSFSLPFVESTHQLVVRHAAYEADTLTVARGAVLRVMLRSVAREVEGVQVTGERSATVIDYMSAASVQRMTSKELTRAACCNLSESFETNPAVDVSFTDAITGTKQIEMLGLSGIYTQTSLENMPYIRGLTSNVGLTFIPGSWIHAINVSKGVGSVANGYESITGQIDVDLRKPNDPEERRLFVNAYGNADQRFEGNLNFRQELGEHWSSMTLLHASGQQQEIDRNTDRFLDMPVFSTFNAIQRWGFDNHDGWEGQLVLQFVDDRKEGGTHAAGGLRDFRYGTRAQFLRASGKTGHVFEGRPYQSVGVQWSLGRYRTASTYGPRDYEAVEETGYLNVLYQSIIGTTEHTYRIGASFLFDRFDERFHRSPFERTERVPGVFAEYTYAHDDEFTVVAGLRADRHNAYGTMITPRIHLRYALTEDLVFRAGGGRGYRTASIFAENATVFASNRAVTIEPSRAFGYGLDQEVAWNAGVNLTHYFLIDYREATVSLDYYHTFFESQVVADLDTRPREVLFRSLQNGSYANSVQLELNMEPFEHLETRLAYRYLDVRQNLNGTWLQRALNAQHRALLTIGYTPGEEGEDEPRMTYDFTLQWFGPKRIPSTATNPDGHRARDRSPAFATVNAQVTRSLFAGLELYVGAENLLDFRQDDPIITPDDPASATFDAALIWGPLGGRMVYAGLRWGI